MSNFMSKLNALNSLKYLLYLLCKNIAKCLSVGDGGQPAVLLKLLPRVLGEPSRVPGNEPGLATGKASTLPAICTIALPHWSVYVCLFGCLCAYICVSLQAQEVMEAEGTERRQDQRTAAIFSGTVHPWGYPDTRSPHLPSEVPQKF